jgi:hypothetical protein
MVTGESFMVAVKIPHKELFMQDSQETSEGGRATRGGDESHFSFLTISFSISYPLSLT